MLKLKTVVYLTVLSYVISSSATWANSWELEKQKSKVTVYSQKTASGYRQVLAKTKVKAPPSALTALLNDNHFAPEWIHNCLEVKILEELSPSERLINTFFAAPWPVKDRDMVTLSTTRIIGGIVEIEISDRSDAITPHAKFVRMKNMYGLWKATPLANGITEISYQGGGDPGGNLPAFIANRELVSSIYHTFLNLNQVIVKEKYQSKEITN
jgi:hypothetical protein